MRFLAITVVVFVVLAALCAAATYYVPDNFPKIQTAIDQASSGDTIIVRPGIYVENIDFIGKAITVKSEKGPHLTIIDGGQPVDPKLGSVVFFKSGEGRDALLGGFTITNGKGCEISPGVADGGGIYCLKDCGPTIKNNIVTNNVVIGQITAGGGISCRGYARITNNTICNNQADMGGGIYCATDYHYGNSIIADNVICNNYVPMGGGGVFYAGLADSRFMNNVVYGNVAEVYGGGVVCDYSAVEFNNNTIVYNRVENNGPGGGIHVTAAHILIYNSIFWGNEPDQVEGYYPDVNYCAVQDGYQGTGNISDYPRFVDPLNGDFHIRYDSPCREAGKLDIFYFPKTDCDGDPRPGIGTDPGIGADEFYPNFHVNGKIVPGETATVVIIGLPKTSPLVLITGAGMFEKPMTTPYGELWLMAPWEVRAHFNPIPDNGVRTVSNVITTPLSMGTQIPAQVLIGTQLSNLWVIEVGF